MKARVDDSPYPPPVGKVEFHGHHFPTPPIQLRDWLAGMAMLGLHNEHFCKEIFSLKQDLQTEIPRWAYGMADAMMRERGE